MNPITKVYLIRFAIRGKSTPDAPLPKSATGPQPRDPTRKKMVMYAPANSFAEAEAYFWDHLDLKAPMERADVSLNTIIFHQKLGVSMEEE